MLSQIQRINENGQNHSAQKIFKILNFIKSSNNHSTQEV